MVKLVKSSVECQNLYHTGKQWCTRNLNALIFRYRKVSNSNASCLEAHAGFFRLLMKGIFGTYICPFDKKLLMYIRTHNFTAFISFFSDFLASTLWRWLIWPIWNNLFAWASASIFKQCHLWLEYSMWSRTKCWDKIQYFWCWVPCLLRVSTLQSRIIVAPEINNPIREAPHPTPS